MKNLILTLIAIAILLGGMFILLKDNKHGIDMDALKAFSNE